MRRIHPIALLCLTLLFLILAMTTGVAVLWGIGVLAPFPLTTVASSLRQPPSSLPQVSKTLAYDTRECRAHPAPQTCDGKLPKAAWDAQVSAGLDGNEACLDGSGRTLSEQPIDALHPERGTITLFWLPPCHTFYAQIEVLQAVSEMTVTISSPQTHRAYTSREHLASFSKVNLLASPLLFVGENCEPIEVSGRLTLLNGSILPFSLEAQAP